MKTYVIGDVHGQLDYLKVMLDEIKKSNADGKEYEIIFAGDIVDRGKNSYATYQFVKELSAKDCQKLTNIADKPTSKRGPKITHILGNHDDFFSGNNAGTEQLNLSIERDANGVLRTMESAFDYYSVNDISALIADGKSEKDMGSYQTAVKAYDQLKRLEKYNLLENENYKNIFEKLLGYKKEAFEVQGDFNRWGDEDVKIFTGSKKLSASHNTSQDETNIYFLYQVLKDMKKYFSQLPIIAERQTTNNSFVITHSGFIPTEKDDKGNDTRILTDAEIKRSQKMRRNTLCCREFLTRNNQECSTPRERVMNHIICHGHTSNKSDISSAAINHDGELASINLDAGAYHEEPSLRSVELQTGRLISVSGDSINPDLVKVKQYQLRTQVKGDEGAVTPLSEQLRSISSESATHKVDKD